MQFLTLLRHGAASYDSNEILDLHRPLSSVGEIEAKLMASPIAKLSSKPDAIITSNAIRTMSTAKIIIEENIWQSIPTENHAELYLASLEILIKNQKRSDATKHLLLINHNPGLSELANRLIPSFVAFMPTCSCLSIKFKENVTGLDIYPQIESYKYDCPDQFV